MRKVLAPASIAVLGASNRPGAFGERALINLKQFGGRVYPVNPRYETVHDLTCYPNVAALPEVPDCAVICAAREAVEDIVVQCAEARVGGAIIFASGYAEVGLPERVEQQDRLGAIARESGLRIVGPNCIGTINTVSDCLISFMTLTPPPKLGHRNIGLVSQSGALGFSLAQAAARGVSFSHAFTSGNSCDIDMSDLVSYLADDPDCHCIACVFEGSSNPERLLQAAEIAWRNNKPLVVFKIAKGEQGAAAAMSHTGSLAGTHATYRAALERAGVIMVEEYEDLIDTATFFAKAKEPTGTGVAVLASSGGAAIMAADSAEVHGVALPPPPAELKALLESHIPDFGVANNPVDVTAQVLNMPDSFNACATALLAHHEYSAMVVPVAYASPLSVPRYAAFDEFSKQADKLTCYVWANEYLAGPGMREIETADNLAFFRSMDHCFRTLAAWQWREARRNRPDPGPERRLGDGAREKAATLIRSAHSRALTEREAKEVLALYGIPVVRETLAGSAEEAAAAAEALGFPVVLKAESPDLPHKTEAGVIRLNLKSAAEVREAFTAIVDRAQKVVPTPRVNGVLVQPMVPPGVEMVVGGRVDPLFGPLVVVGLGGVLVELLKDTAILPAPVSRIEALDMIRSLKGVRLLEGFRNLPPVDLDRLAQVICAVSQFIADQREIVAELDVNPLISAGERIIAVDALIVRA
ncbi:MAG: acetate--CoA ligase family protein [Alphaproteobacteria bacterium]|nr:acetate--CoA ligase family protein [Alphaproteobacteria bacterium]